MISLGRRAIAQLNIHLKRQNIKSVRFLCSNKGNQRNPFDQEDQDRNLQVPTENPFKRTARILGDDLRNMFGTTSVSSDTNDGNIARRKSYQEDKFQVNICISLINLFNQNLNLFQLKTHCDVVVIGGGGMGSSIAYWLKKRAREGLNVVVVEKDPTVS
jgi:FAD-dependent oxidoreductase domain-containing protein 1